MTGMCTWVHLSWKKQGVVACLPWCCGRCPRLQAAQATEGMAAPVAVPKCWAAGRGRPPWCSEA